jgi:DNA polymerase V
MYALVDCNNFYVSCERAFAPHLEHQPVVVLSNNDGCVIARSNQAKQLGIRMGQPFHEVRNLVAQAGLVVFSANFALYGDMSRRVMGTLAQFSQALEVYSIDEAFLSLSGSDPVQLLADGQLMRQTVRQWTHIPVSVGIGATKTLCKAAAELAKKSDSGVYVVTDQNREATLRQVSVADVWGVGRKYAQRLQQAGLHTAWDLHAADDATLKRLIRSVTLARTVWELRGKPCIALDLAPAAKKSIVTSRAFGQPVTTLAGLQQAVATYTGRACWKLRQAGLATQTAQVFIQTNPFRPWLPQTHQSAMVTLPVATQSTQELSGAIQGALTRIYKPNFDYHKAGVVLLDLTPANTVQAGLFDTVDRDKHRAVMKVLDAMNATWGAGTVHYAAEGLRQQAWRMQQAHRSRRFTTRLNELWEVT